MQSTQVLHRGNYGLVRCQEAACGQRLELGRILPSEETSRTLANRTELLSHGMALYAKR